MKKTLIYLAAALLVVSSCANKKQESCPVVQEEPEQLPLLGFSTDTLRAVEGTIRSGQTFSGLMTGLGMDSADAYKLYESCDTVFDVRTIKAGNDYTAYYSLDSLDTKLRYVVYNKDRIDMVVFRCEEPFGLYNVSKPVDHVLKHADITINTSLWNDIVESGSSPLLVSELSDIYAWTVDFFGLQKGDRFNLLYGQTECEGEIVSIDTVYISLYTRDSTELYAIMYNQGDSGNIYWNEKGESMRKAFLKAPLKFTRISSGFSYRRKHPVTGQIRPHTAVDYAAPTGTPVMSIGDGVVISVGWDGGGGGNTVKIRHNSVYTTAYLHLSRYAKGLKTGQRVAQGDVIGYVGMTGTATGPHLDFRVWKNGSPINPLTMESPSAEPIKPENMAALDCTFRFRKAQLEGWN